MVDLKEEQQYERLRKLGQELHIPIPEAFWTLEAFDKEGHPICPKCSFPAIKGIRLCPNCGAEIRHHQRSHSWVRNAYNHMFTELAAKDADDGTFGAGKLSIKDTAGAIKSGDCPVCISPATSVDGTASGYRAAAGDNTRGIVVGSGTNAENFEDYALQTQVAEGAGAGQLNHAQSEAHSITYTPATKVLENELVRYFNNNSGGDIGVNEVALYAHGRVAGAAPDWLQARDKLPSTVTVPDTGQLKVTYTVQLTFPA